jgi:rhodanese-related sulfurtransferase
MLADPDQHQLANARNASMTDPAIGSTTPAGAAELMSAGATLLDVREPDEWVAGHAPDAIHIPLGDLDGAALPDGPLLTICRSGGRSMKAAATLLAKGREVTNVDGGMNAWSAAGLPVVASGGADGRVA